MTRRSDHYLPVPGEEKNQDGNQDCAKPRNNESIPMKSIHADDGSPLHPKLGPFFRDGHRRVDYILEYSIQKPNSARRHSTIFGNDNFLRRLRRSLSMRGSKAPLQPKEDPEFAAQEHRADYHEDDKSYKRKEFEENLQEAGLELEWDEENHIPGVGFLKIHAPWDILCREAELMKLKMPTRKTYEVKQGSNLVEKIRLFIHKATAPLHPKVDSNQQLGLKHLSHPFSREKEHLFDLSNKDKFFDSKTRSSIVHEVLKRTKCERDNYSMGITSLLANSIYTAAYPPHDFSEYI